MPLPADVATSGPGPRLRWTALSYDLPTDDSGTRAFVWRQLRARHALNLRHGLWAIADPAGGVADLTSVEERLRAVGATVTARSVGADRPDDLDLHQRLAAACDQLWSHFFAAADRLTALSGARTSGPDAVASGLPALHDLFRRTLGRDMVQTPAVARAVQRLDDLEWMQRNLSATPSSPPMTDRSSGAVRRSVSTMSTVALDDGTVRIVAVLQPPPTVTWERGFEEFERAVYRPDPQRAVIRHGTVVAVGTHNVVADALVRVDDRLGRFFLTQV